VAHLRQSRDERCRNVVRKISCDAPTAESRKRSVVERTCIGFNDRCGLKIFAFTQNRHECGIDFKRGYGCFLVKERGRERPRSCSDFENTCRTFAGKTRDAFGGGKIDEKVLTEPLFGMKTVRSKQRARMCYLNR